MHHRIVKSKRANVNYIKNGKPILIIRYIESGKLGNILKEENYIICIYRNDCANTRQSLFR